jgi:glyoxylase-like metal-dependent hydrolase (beta-lactamase superfamily II)
MGIALTHGHFDHISAVGALVHHFDGRGIHLQVAIHERDVKYLGDSSEAHHKKDLINLGLFYSEEMAGRFLTPLPSADIILQESDRLFDTDLTVLDTPGHTQGGVCFFSDEDRVLFSGDTLFFEGIGRSDIPGGDEQQLIQNIRDKLFSLPPDTKVYPGHGPVTTIGEEIRSNPFTRL